MTSCTESISPPDEASFTLRCRNATAYCFISTYPQAIAHRLLRYRHQWPIHAAILQMQIEFVPRSREDRRMASARVSCTPHHLNLCPGG